MAPPPSNDPVAFACAVKRLFPASPSAEALAVAVFVCRRGRGRVSSTAIGQVLAREAIRRAVVAHVRHSHTPYDGLLRVHGDRALARAQVSEEIEEVLWAWSDVRRPATRACAPCWQTLPRHLRTIERELALRTRREFRAA